MSERYRVGVLTVSDKGAQGLRADESGRVVAEMLTEQGYKVVKKDIVPDDLERIVSTLVSWVDIDGLCLIVTSGGTGLSPRDITPQAMKQVIDFEVPGMAEAMRAASLQKTPHAMISRAMAGVRTARAPSPEATGAAPGSCLLINLPGSPRGARENLSVVLPALDHALSKLGGDPSECAVP